MFGPIGREVLGAGLVILLVFAASSHILTFTIAMNVITQHSTCTIVWAAVALVLFFIASIPRTLKNVSYLSVIGMFEQTCEVSKFSNTDHQLYSILLCHSCSYGSHDRLGNRASRSCCSSHRVRSQICIRLFIRCEHRTFSLSAGPRV